VKEGKLGHAGFPPSRLALDQIGDGTGDAAIMESRIARTKVQHGMLLGGLLLVVGLTAAFLPQGRAGDGPWLGLLLVAMGAGVALHAVWRGRDRSALLRIDDAGVWFRDWGCLLAWRHLEDAYQTGSRLQTFVALKTRDPGRFLASLPDAEARKLRGNRLWKAPELRIPSGAVEASQQEILAAIRARMAWLAATGGDRDEDKR